MNEDFAWFKDHYKDFQKEYGDTFIAIKNKRVLGTYKSYADGVRDVSKTEELGTFIIQECSSHREAYSCCIASMLF